MAPDILNGDRSAKTVQIRFTENRSTMGGRELISVWFQKRYRVAQITERDLKFTRLRLIRKPLFGFLLVSILT